MTIEYKGTRKEAIKICYGIAHPEALIQALEMLKVITFKPEIETIFIDTDHMGKYGEIRLQVCPEGLCLWVGGKMVWKSWENK